MAEQLEIKIKPHLEGLNEDHPAFGQSTAELMSDFRDITGLTITERDRPHDGPSRKGALQNIFLVPGGASAALAAVQIVKLWLSRDRRRSIDITIVREDDEFKVHASGDKLSLDTLEKTVNQALKSGKK